MLAAYTIQLLLRRALCRRPTVVGRTRTLSDYAQQVHSHYATKVGSNSVRITAFVADLLKVNVACPSGFKLVNLVVCYHGFHKPEKETCRNKKLQPFHSEPSASEYGLNSPSPDKTRRVCHISISSLSFSSIIQSAIFSSDKTRGGECACYIVIDFSLNTLFITFNTFSHTYSVD